MVTKNREPNPLLHCLWQAPFSSPNDLSGWGHLTLSQCQKGLQELRREGLAMQFTLGIWDRAKARWCLAEEGIHHCQRMLHEELPSPIVESGLRNLSGRLLMMEQVYALLPKVMDTAEDQPSEEGVGATGPMHRGHQVPVAGEHRHPGGGGI